MLFFYALLFCLFGIYVAAVPVHTDRELAIPMPNDEANFWVLKKPKDNHQLSDVVMQIDHGGYNILTLNNKFEIVQKRRIMPHEKASLAGVWHLVPTSQSKDIYRSRELVITAVGDKIASDFSTTWAAALTSLPPAAGHPQYVTPKIGNGYWVLGDVTRDMSTHNWRSIFQIENGKYYTFSLDKNLKIIATSRKEVVALPPGDYFSVPFDGMEIEYRFAVLKARENGNGISMRVIHL